MALLFCFVAVCTHYALFYAFWLFETNDSISAKLVIFGKILPLAILACVSVWCMRTRIAAVRIIFQAVASLCVVMACGLISEFAAALFAVPLFHANSVCSESVPFDITVTLALLAGMAFGLVLTNYVQSIDKAILLARIAFALVSIMCVMAFAAIVLFWITYGIQMPITICLGGFCPYAIADSILYSRLKAQKRKRTAAASSDALPA
jgi:hypothetical protein